MTLGGLGGLEGGVHMYDTALIIQRRIDGDDNMDNSQGIRNSF